MRTKPWNGSWWRLAILVPLLTWSCSSPTRSLGYAVIVPTLMVYPRILECTTTDAKTGEKEDADCILVYGPDWYAIITELKAACLASGQSADACQAVMPQKHQTQKAPQPIPQREKQT